ncbi:uncharacterized protein LOC144449728 [Glandiceps talaboti]
MDSPGNTESPLSDTDPAAQRNPEKHITSRVSTLSGLSFLSTRSSLTSAPDSQADDLEEDSNVNVVVRVRPLSTQESSRTDAIGIEFPGENSIVIEHQGRTKSLTFNNVFEPPSTQEEVFDNCGIKRLIEMSMDGYACTTFAYGQTGSGKTHTITGPLSLVREEPPNNKMFGLINRSFQYLFDRIKQNSESSGITYTLTASYLEIYNEQVKDLLNPSERANLAVRWSKTKGFYVENLFIVECESPDDLMAVVEEGLSHRQTGSNNINEYSSRSHSMLSLFIDSEPDPDDDTLYITKQGKLSFVDLAGSEKIKELGNTSDLLTETTNINKSLLTLGNCISSLSDPKKKSGYIPYRDSKLTKLLADSLGGNGVTLMIACVSPSAYCLPETMNTLRYANRAKRIKNKPVVRMDPREKLLMSLKREVKLLRSENEYLKTYVHKKKPQDVKTNEETVTPKPALANGHVQVQNNSQSNDTTKSHSNGSGKSNGSTKSQPRKDRKARESTTSSASTSLSMKSAADNGLYEMLQEYMVENENLRSENSELSGTRERARREHEHLSKENEKLLRKLEDLERVMATSPLSFARYSFYSRGSSSRSSQQMALQQYQQQQQQYPPNAYQPPPGQLQQPPPPQQQQQQQQPYQQYPQQQAQQPYIQQSSVPPVRSNGGQTYRAEPTHQPPPKKQPHELPPVDNMKGVPNNFKAHKPPSFQQKNSKNKLLDSPRSQDPSGSYVDRFQQQQTFNKLYSQPGKGSSLSEQSGPRQANINIPPARGLEKKEESTSPPEKQSKPQAASSRSNDKTVSKPAERKGKGARNEKDPSLDAIPATPAATPPPVKYIPKGTHEMLKNSSIDTPQSTPRSSGNWSQINDKLRQELQDLDGEIEYMKYMNKSQSQPTAPKPAPRSKKR